MSSTRPVRSSANFLLMMLDAMSGTDSIVAVASRSVYRRRSAGATSVVWPINTQPIRSTCSRAAASVRSVRIPGIDSSLSRVPPVCPSPRPDIIGTVTPNDAINGARMSDVLSPTPPVECLSTRAAAMWANDSWAPLRRMASVNAAVSMRSRPLRYTAMSIAAI